MLSSAVIVLVVLLALSPIDESGIIRASAETLNNVDDSQENTLGLGGSGSEIESVSDLGTLSPIFTEEIRFWEDRILLWAREFDLDPDLAAIIMQVESCGDPEAVSIAGAQGLFQVMPFHFAEGENSLDPDTNARRGLSYFTGRLEQTGGDIGRSYAGYNGGHVAAASSWDNWANETQRYYIWTTGLYRDAKSGVHESPTLQKWIQAGGASLCQQAALRLGI